MFSKKNSLVDFCVVCGLIIFGFGISLYTHANLLVLVIFYLVIPSLFLCFRKRKNLKKIFLASLFQGIFIGMTYNIAIEYGNAYMTHYASPLLNYIIVGVTPLGDFIWAFFIPFFTFVFYEHFLDDEKHPKLSKHFYSGLVPLSFCLTTVWTLLFIHPKIFELQYAYLLLGSLTVIIPLCFARNMRRPQLIKLLWMSSFFFITNLLFEIIALRLQLGTYPGKYVGLISIFGVQFPIEELVFWIMLSAPSFVLCYEYFVDDGK